MDLQRSAVAWLLWLVGWVVLDQPVARVMAAEAPNIIVVLADDFGFGDVSCYGGPYPTPNLDRMATEGVRFTQFYVASPICSPSRAGIITGQFPGRWQITSFLQTRKGNRDCEQVDFLSRDAPSLPRTLRAAGYATAHIGKWHLGGGRDVTNAPKFADYGYDLGFGTWESPEPHPEITASDWIWSTRDPVSRWDRTRWMVDRTLEFLHSHSSQPCFVNLWLDDTHTPWVPGKDELDGEHPKAGNDERNFLAVLTEMDRQLGRMLDGIRMGTSNRETFVLFLGDNGALPTFNQKRTHGLRGSKLSLYEGGIRVPCIAWCPKRVPADSVNSTTVFATVDLFPTLCAFAGVSVPEGYVSDGEDLSPALRGESPKRKRALFWEYGRNDRSFAFPKDKRHRSPNLAMRDGPWKLLVNGDGSSPQLFHLENDPHETKNLIDAESGQVERLREQLLTWRKTLPELKPLEP